ncbi:Hypothetical protein CINCED_3A004376 [Cinara cedri]|uniref:Uncharacterized protein n=1 Tax=Cinara cedri TaxID=506608 RepID=A0A5E4NTJ2_9HEMI|nr:Hypothetical protein CINCED_3A004376 [Cinara cedri]
MQNVINSGNKIKAKSLNDRLFRHLCHDNVEDFERLILHTEVRWQSKGNCLTHIYNLFQTILEFLQPLDKQLYDELQKIETNIAYLANIFKNLMKYTKFPIEEELLEVKHNEEVKLVFKHNEYELFWLKQKTMYPQLWKKVELLIMALLSTYLVEKNFSAVQQLLTKLRN